MISTLRSATILAIAASALAYASVGRAEDYRPVLCATAAPYRGGALHSALDPLPDAVAEPLVGTLDDATSQRLQMALDTAFQATRAEAMSVAVGLPGRGVWVAQRGSDKPLFYWASVGKQATAVIVLQLVQEGRLSLSDPISRWVSGVPNGDAITIEMLLNHTSGLFSANEDLRVHRANRVLDASAELEVLRRHGAMFCPGERWRYSNSGYSLLGQVIEQVDGRPLAEALRRRIIDPLGLTQMLALRADTEVGEVTALHSDTSEPALDIRIPGAAGPFAASALDMIRLEQALLDGRLLNASSWARRVRDLYPMFQPDMFYGLGVMAYDVPDPQGRSVWIGHSGGAPGVKAVSVYVPSLNAFVAVALSGDGSAEASANLFLRAIPDPQQTGRPE